jgi:benzoate/toluate 1,2-dioxygenase beta subunit
MVTNVEVFAARPAASDGEGQGQGSASSGRVRMVRSNLLISEFRVDGTRMLSGWCGHRFVEVDGVWQIQVRQVNLIDCDQNLRNPSIVI